MQPRADNASGNWSQKSIFEHFFVNFHFSIPVSSSLDVGGYVQVVINIKAEGVCLITACHFIVVLTDL